MKAGYGAMRPSGKPLRTPDTNPEVKNLFRGQSTLPLSHSTPKGGPKGLAMTSIAQINLSWSKN